LPEDFEHAKNVVRDRIETSEKSAFDKLDAELYKGLPDGYTKEEMLNDLKTLTLDDVKALYTDVCNNGQGVITVAAPFDRKPELRQDVFNEGAAFKPAKEYKANEPLAVFKPVNETKVLTDVDFKNQAEIVQAYKFQTNGNLKDKATINILNTILGGNPSSRLFMDLREKEKLAYHVKSNCSSTDDIGLFTLKIGTTTDNSETGEQHFENVQKSIDGFNRHIQKMTDEKVTDEELNNAKLSLKNALLNSTQASDDKIQVLSKSSSTPYGSARINLLFEEIDKVTAEDIQNAAKYIFSNKPTYSIVATEATLNANKEYLESLTNN
jgi:predicted Zn-dependent peptidase